MVAFTDAKTLDKSFDYPSGKHLFTALLLALSYDKCPPLSRNNSQDHIFLKGSNHLRLVFFLPMFIFFEKMYLWNDETGILEFLENKIVFVAQPTMVGRLL